MEERKSKIHELLKDDPLYKAVVKKKYDITLYSDEYLEDINIEKLYGTVQVAEWFGISDSQLRYYIKPFHEYLFEEDTPSNEYAYRLGFVAILKLRMIFLLKSEHKMKGLEVLINGEGRVLPKSENTFPKHVLDQRLETLSTIVEQITNTGLFILEQDEESETINLTLNNNLFDKLRDAQNSQTNIRINLLQERESIKTDLKIEQLRLDETKSRIKDIERYISVMKLKSTSEKSKSFLNRLFKSNQTDEEAAALIQKAQEDYEFLQDKENVIKETIKSKEKELKLINDKVEASNTRIESSTNQITDKEITKTQEEA